MSMKPCLYCTQPFDETSLLRGQRRSMYCSNKCRSVYHQGKYGRTKQLDLPPGTIGALAELLVATDLLKKGWEVYRSLSPSCSGDLLIQQQSKTFKVEVRTSYKHLDTGKLTFSPLNVRADIVALVTFRTNEIQYISWPTRVEVILDSTDVPQN